MKNLDTATEKYMDNVIEYVVKIHGEAALMEMTTEEGMKKYMKLYNDDYQDFVRKVLDAPAKAREAMAKELGFNVWAKVNKQNHDKEMAELLN